MILTKEEKRAENIENGLALLFVMFLISGGFFCWYLMQVVADLVPVEEQVNVYGSLGVSGFVMTVSMIVFAVIILTSNTKEKKGVSDDIREIHE